MLASSEMLKGLGSELSRTLAKSRKLIAKIINKLAITSKHQIAKSKHNRMMATKDKNRSSTTKLIPKKQYK